LLEHDKPVTRAWVLHPELKNDHTRRDATAGLAEGVSLAAALPDLEVVGSTIVRLPKLHPGMLFGKGKIEELSAMFKAAHVELVLIDGPVTPVQQRNLEKAWGVKLLDRTGLILEIFSDRARTSEGVLQVEMAALSYQRTRLVRAWTHLERQRGGLGFVGGPGETQIEADRRAIDDQLNRLRKQLAKVVKTRELHRASRAKVPFPIVALVGYTNAGKSTLFNHLTGADVFAKDMLFATLDPTMRKIDLIVHVRDISHPQSQEQAKDVTDILAALGVADTAPMIEVWNKIDLLDPDELDAKTTLAERTDGLFAVSAITGAGLDPLLAAVAENVKDPRVEEVISLTFAQGRERAWLFDAGVVTHDAQTEEGYALTPLGTVGSHAFAPRDQFRAA